MKTPSVFQRYEPNSGTVPHLLMSKNL